MRDPGDDPLIRELREQIDLADQQLLDAFSKRLRTAVAIARRKEACGFSPIDPKREQDLLDDWRSVSAGEIPDESLRELFDLVLALSKREVSRPG
jgi:chorismate mutase